MATACALNAITHRLPHTSAADTTANAITGASANPYADSRSASVRLSLNEHVSFNGPDRLGFDVRAIEQNAP